MVLMGATTGVGHVTGAVLFLATCVLLSAVAVVEAVLSVRRAVEAGRRVPKSDG
jgi:cell division protein FtsL